jgi:hypothetical protein
VLKPAEQTPLAAIVTARLCLEAGIPAGVVNVVQGSARWSARRWSSIPASTPSASRARATRAAGSRPPPPPASSESAWSWAARARRSSSTTPTSTPPRRPWRGRSGAIRARCAPPARGC